VSYRFGFLAEIGAGGFDASTVLPALRLPVPASTAIVAGGRDAPPPTIPSAVSLATALPSTPITASLTVDIVDSLTYDGPTTTTVNGVTVEVRADNPERPLFRWTTGTAASPATWTITGGGPGSVLILQGIWLQGADIVITGNFDTVHLRLVTVDPGSASSSGVTPPNQEASLPSSPFFGIAIDGLPFRPSTLYVEGTVGRLVLERCITGPIRTRNGGAVEKLEASDSILQAIATHAPGEGPLVDPADLATVLKNAPSGDALAQGVVGAVAALSGDLAAYTSGTRPADALVADLRQALGLQTTDVRAQLEARSPLAFADLALGFSSGTVSLSRCTVLGKSAAHRVEASESIFDDVIAVEDPQRGCVRFSAYAQGSNLHQPYRSVAVPPAAPLFVSRDFGNPEYARLRRDADASIVAPQIGDTILGGAANASEMGAFSSERISLKKRGLALKFTEFMPLGVAPVWIDAD
jgi:hypothetical protein